MKNYILLSTIVVILLALPSLANAQTCGDHPVLPLLERFVTTHNKYVNNATRPNKKDDDEPFNGDSILQAFKQSQGSAVNDLSICKDYNSGNDDTKLSCCTNDLVKLFPKLTKGFFRRRIANPPEPTKLLKTLKFFGRKCGVEDVDSIDAKDEVNNILENFKNCQKNSTAADVNLLRGTLCSLCVPPSGFSQYFDADASNIDNLKIFVTKHIIDKYDNDIQEGLTCFDQAQDEFASLVDSITATWNQTECSEEIDIIGKILADPQRKFGRNKGCKGKARPMSDEGCLKDTEEDNKKNYPQYLNYTKRSEDDGPLKQKVGKGNRPNIPGQQGNRPNIPGQQGNRPNIPGQQGNRPNIPGQQGNRPNIPGQQGNKPNIPGQQGNKPNIPGQQGNKPNIPGQQGSRPNIPGQQGSRPNIPNRPGQQGQGQGQRGQRPNNGGNRRRQLLEQRILSGTGGYVESANGLDNIYQKDDIETESLIAEKAIDGVVEAAVVENDTPIQPGPGTTPKINNTYSQVLQLGSVLLLALVSLLLL